MSTVSTKSHARRSFIRATAGLGLGLIIAKPLLAKESLAQRKTFNVREFGAAGDGKSMDTAAIQSAIDKANAEGGGVVHLSDGTYLSGTIVLKTGVTLDLAEGALLLGSPSLKDYRRGHWVALVMARDQSNIGITGKGTISGNSPQLIKEFDRIKNDNAGLDFFPEAAPGTILRVIGPTGSPMEINPYELQEQGKLVPFVYGRSGQRPNEFVRPQVLEFWGCKNIVIQDVTLRDSACWVETYRDCEDIRIERLKVRSTTYWNNDGIDLVDCRRVTMRDCDLDSADDALCLKSDPRGEGCADITVSSCRLASHASAIKFGTASHHGFQRIHISDCVVHDTGRSVIGIQSVDGGLIQDITVERIKATNTGNAFFLRLGHRTKSKAPGIIRNVVVRDIEVEMPSMSRNQRFASGAPHNQVPSSVVGIPGSRIENVVLENISVSYGGDADPARAQVALDKLDSVPEVAGDYPEFTMFGELPSWGVYLRHTKGITLRNLQLSLRAPDFRPAIVADDCADLNIEEVSLGNGGGEPLVVLKDSPKASVTFKRLPSGASEKVRVL